MTVQNKNNRVSEYRRRLQHTGSARTLVVTPVFDAFWRFAAERQNILYKRLQDFPAPWTSDPILTKYRFTNPYRVSDRVSQYLIRNVIYSGEFETTDLFFRIILFKLFNRIETWELLAREIGHISWNARISDHVVKVLEKAQTSGRSIYSAAYIMAPGSGKYLRLKKHEAHLKLLGKMINDGVPDSLRQCSSMREAFLLLRGYPMIGDFLGYQLVTDLNYSTITEFSESEFTIPGPGARDGIRKCFPDLNGLSEVDVIKLMCEIQDEEFESRGINFKRINDRPLQYIDIQNLFCEIDKYSRVAFPDVHGISQRTKIKQLFRPNLSPISLRLPPKWEINEKLAADNSHAPSNLHKPDQTLSARLNISRVYNRNLRSNDMQTTDPLMSASLDSLQALQWHHDQQCHQEILTLPLKMRLTHFVLHQAKYAGKLATLVAEGDSQIFEDVLVDCFIIALATANSLNLRLSKVFSPLAKGPVRTLHVSPREFALALVGSTGRMAKALESLDHIESFDTRSELERQTIEIINQVLLLARQKKWDIRSRIKDRWNQIEKKFVIFNMPPEQDGLTKVQPADDVRSMPLFLRASK